MVGIFPAPRGNVAGGALVSKTQQKIKYYTIFHRSRKIKPRKDHDHTQTQIKNSVTIDKHMAPQKFLKSLSSESEM